MPRNAAAARETVTRLLASRIHGPAGEGLAEVVVSDALLVTSELVTNAFRHGGGLTGFTAELTGEGLLLAVADASTDAPLSLIHKETVSEATAGRWCAVWRSGCPSRSIPAASASSP
ncbi:ATP-binding protein [Streptomyces sp. NRRL S-15]|uniref:ATP-binding protein n=1 Tax=Streptomyces sp. NRRL S-15 TaxID=1463886 RepID=UPI000AA3D637|nr:ATP-binding protein [Streptomyces sp. NRRL S-15]